MSRKQTDKKYYDSNQDKIKEKRKLRYQKNKEIEKAKALARYYKNKSKEPIIMKSCKYCNKTDIIKWASPDHCLECENNITSNFKEFKPIEYESKQPKVDNTTRSEKVSYLLHGDSKSFLQRLREY